jgi:predicted MPP superfamily phosphohydrolase
MASVRHIPSYPEHPAARRRELARAVLAGLVMAGVAGAGGLAQALGLERSWVDVSHVRLRLPRLGPPFHGYRIAQLSDLHIEWLGGDRLAELVGLVNALQPDLIAMTGDYVTATYERVAEDLVPGLSGLRARDGVVAVLGNHDYWGRPGPGVVLDALRAAGVRDLNNAVFTLERDGDVLHIAGLDSVRARRHRLDRVLSALPTEGTAVLLVHEPDYADVSARTGRFDLQLSGHSHGGQVVLPFVGPPRLPPLARKYYDGLYMVGRMLHYTNRGIGTVGLPVRFRCRPEITLFTLEPAQPPSQDPPPHPG